MQYPVYNQDYWFLSFLANRTMNGCGRLLIYSLFSLSMIYFPFLVYPTPAHPLRLQLPSSNLHQWQTHFLSDRKFISGGLCPGHSAISFSSRSITFAFTGTGGMP
jgi:hypothetical protein